MRWASFLSCGCFESGFFFFSRARKSERERASAAAAAAFFLSLLRFSSSFSGFRRRSPVFVVVLRFSSSFSSSFRPPNQQQPPRRKSEPPPAPPPKKTHQAPEHLHDGQRRRRHRVGKVAAGRRDGAHDRHAALALRRAQARDAARPLVEGGQARPQVGRVARVRGHLGEAAGDLAEGLGPARGGVAHHAEVVALLFLCCCVSWVLGFGFVVVFLGGGRGGVVFLVFRRARLFFPRCKRNQKRVNRQRDGPLLFNHLTMSRKYSASVMPV